MDLEEKVKYLERIESIKNNYCSLIIDIGCDYDGEDTVEGLKELIDEIVEYARAARANDDKQVIYGVGPDSKKLNILFEPVE